MYDFMVTEEIHRLETEGQIREALQRAVEEDVVARGVSERMGSVEEQIEEILDALSCSFGLG